VRSCVCEEKTNLCLGAAHSKGNVGHIAAVEKRQSDPNLLQSAGGILNARDNVDDEVSGFSSNRDLHSSTAKNASLEVMHATARTPYCYTFLPTAGLPGVRACSKFLHSLGSTPCKVAGYQKGSIFCQAADGRDPTYIWGVGMNQQQPKETASSCKDVALAVDWVLSHCSDSVGDVSGMLIYTF
jgi:hypothetical protein